VSKRWWLFSLSLSMLLHAGVAVGLLHWHSGRTVKPIIYSPSFTVALYKPTSHGTSFTKRTKATGATSQRAKSQSSLNKATKAGWKIKTRVSHNKKKKTVRKRPQIASKALSQKESARENALLEKALAQVTKEVALGGSGVNREAVEIQYKEYYDEIWRGVRVNWILPEGVATGEQSFMAVVIVRIARDGSLLKVELEKSSGDRIFDASCIRAAKKTAPFPPLPENYRGQYMELGLRFIPR